MALLRINLEQAGLAEHATGRSAADALQAAADRSGPVIVMIHGFKFAPGSAAYCPHDHILSLTPDESCWKARSWPRELGLDAPGTDSTGIAFGWPARGSIWQAYDRAKEAGEALATLIRQIRRTMPQRPVHILAHSLGARVALSALPHLPPHALDRLVLLAGAEFRTPAEAALATPAGRTAEVISITSRENRPYDRLLERALASADSSRAIGLDAPKAANWLSLPIDNRAILTSLAQMGHDIAPPQRWVCHWSSYLRPGVFSLYAALIADRRPLPLSTLRRVTEAAQAPKPRTTFWPLPAMPVWTGRAAG